jgi:hypothetical protein
MTSAACWRISGLRLLARTEDGRLGLRHDVCWPGTRRASFRISGLATAKTQHIHHSLIATPVEARTNQKRHEFAVVIGLLGRQCAFARSKPESDLPLHFSIIAFLPPTSRDTPRVGKPITSLSIHLSQTAQSLLSASRWGAAGASARRQKK